MLNYTSKTSLFLALALCFAACEPEEPPTPNGESYSTGVYLCNEGIFNQTSGTITHYDPVNKQVRSGGDLFRSINNRDLGNVVQSLAFFDTLAYIVVNNSNKIEVASALNWQEKAQITGLNMPRYALPISSRTMFVSEWGNDGLSGAIKVIRTPENQQIASINTYKGPEQLLLHENTVWAVHAGGYDSDNRIAIIDTSQYQLLHTITLPADVPNSLQKDAQGRIWVACGGKTVYSNYPDIDTAQSTPSALLAIVPDSRLISVFYTLDYGGNARNLHINTATQQLYYTYKDGIYAYDIATGLASRIFAGNFYGFGYDNQRQELYAAQNAGIQPAKVFRFSPQGAVIDSFNAGVFCNAAYFRY